MSGGGTAFSAVITGMFSRLAETPAFSLGGAAAPVRYDLSGFALQAFFGLFLWLRKDG
jgi:hypothetical protein